MSIGSIFEQLIHTKAEPPVKRPKGPAPDISIQVYLWYVTRVVEALGWTPRYKATDGAQSSADLALSAMRPDDEGSRKVTLPDAPPFAGRFVEDALEWIRNLEPNGDRFLERLQDVCLAEKISRRDIGMVASLVQKYRQHLERGLMRRVIVAQTQNAGYIGDVGDRVDLTLTVRKVIPGRHFMGQPRYLHLLVDPDGRIATWWSGSGASLNENQTYVVAATVKEHHEQEGVPQTMLYRLSVQNGEK